MALRKLLLLLFISLALGNLACSRSVGFSKIPITETKVEKAINDDGPGVPNNPPNPTPTPEEKIPKPPEDNVASCVLDLSQLYVEGNVNAFEFTGGGGMTFGYNQGGNHGGVSVDATLKIDMARMDLTLLGSDPLTGATLVSTTVGSDFTKTKINGTVNFKDFKASPEAFFSTPLAQVTFKGLTKALNDFKTQTDKIGWMASVVKVVSKENAIINSGELMGLRKGDTLDVYDVKHFWEGEPCKSAYVASQVNETPYATVEMLTPTKNGTSALTKVTNNNLDFIKRGSIVVIRSLVDNAQKERSLKKRVLLGKIGAKPFNIPGGETFDFEWAINYQILDALNKSDAFVFVMH